MSPNAPQFDRGPLANAHNRVQSWGLSLLLHITLITASLLLFWSVGTKTKDIERKGGIALVIAEIHKHETKYLTETVDPRIPEPKLADQASLSAAPSSIPSPNLGDAGSKSLLDQNSAATTADPDQAPASLADVGQMLDSTGGNRLDLRPEMSEEDLQRLAEEQAIVAARKPKGEPIALSVFGSKRFSGRKFVFLLDQSDSMGSGGLGVLNASKSELDREIAKLIDYHEFQIVAYNDRTSMIGKRRLLPATVSNKQLVAGFVDGLVAVGGTEHRGGLMAALGLGPDVIIMISDGGDPALTDRDLALVASLAKGRTQIHCLQFGAGATPAVSSQFMRKLAEQNDGSFRYIDVSQWESNKN